MLSPPASTIVAQSKENPPLTHNATLKVNFQSAFDRKTKVLPAHISDQGGLWVNFWDFLTSWTQKSNICVRFLPGQFFINSLSYSDNILT